MIDVVVPKWGLTMEDGRGAALAAKPSATR